MCHVNVLKLYVSREEDSESKSSVVASVVVLSNDGPDEDGLNLQCPLVTSGRLNNSKVLQDLNSDLLHLSDDQ